MRLQDMFGDLGKLLGIAAINQRRPKQAGPQRPTPRLHPEAELLAIDSSSRFYSRPLETHCRYLRGQPRLYRSLNACQIREIIGGGECLRLLVIDHDVPLVDL